MVRLEDFYRSRLYEVLAPAFRARLAELRSQWRAE
jgi:hypothetical protein